MLYPVCNVTHKIKPWLFKISFIKSIIIIKVKKGLGRSSFSARTLVIGPGERLRQASTASMMVPVVCWKM